MICIKRNEVMPKIKLKEWADKNNLSYLTANRHFHAGQIPGAVQLDSGTILVEDDSLEQNMANNTSGNAMSVFLKKTVEFSKSNSSIEDFAAYIVSNFQLRLNGTVEAPRYSKNKPQSEDVQKHFQQFLPNKEKAEHLKAFKASIKEQVTTGKVELPFDPNTLRIDEPSPFEKEPNPFMRVGPDANGMDAEWEDMAESITSYNFPKASGATVCGPKTITESLVTQSVDFNTTPQQINYTGSTNQTFSDSLSFDSPTVSTYFNAQQAPFQPTHKETLTAAQVADLSEDEETLPKRRGRKPSKVNK